MSHPKIWPCINYDDALGAIAFLKAAFGFVENAVHHSGGHVEHAELLFPEGGGVMLGSARSDGSPFERLSTGSSGLYVVTNRPDAIYETARNAGAKVVRELRHEHWGQRGFTVADPEGNLWSFGTYRGENQVERAVKNAIIWFEIPTRDLDRASAFYEAVLAVRLTRETVAGVPHAIFPVDDFATGITGALVARAPTLPGALGTVIYLVCQEIAAVLERAVAHGGSVVLPATALPQIGTIAAISDLDGNTVGLHAAETEAAAAARRAG